jgi:ubiquinone biosynthesis UbiH/UbiF/VisC/COQ6 family hydroxylase
MDDTPRHDVAIVGAGPAGLCCALAAARAGLQVSVLEQQPRAQLADPACDGREIALTHRSVRTLRELGVWQRIPETEMARLRVARILNGRGLKSLDIDARDGGADALGVLVSNHLIRRAAWQAVADDPRINVRDQRAVASLELRDDAVTVTPGAGDSVHARLLVAADSRHSQIRRLLGIGADLHDFGKTMLACRMTHEQPLAQTAWEWFDEHQTLAVLPVRWPRAGHCSSIVLTAPPSEIATLLQLDAPDFGSAMTRRLDGRLGALTLQGGRHAYPLLATWSRRFVAPRAALIGDAAVGMHPVTAHGFNLGLRGVATLAREIGAALRSGQDIGDANLLARFERQHRRDTWPLFVATQAIVQLYTDERALARLGRRAALAAARHASPFRRLLLELLTERRGAA